MQQIAIYLTSTGFGGLEMNTLKLAHWLSSRYNVTLILNKNSRLINEAQSEGFNCIGISKPKKYFDFKAAKNITRLLSKINTTTVLLIDNKDIDVMAIAKRFFNKNLKIIYQQQMQIGVYKKGLLHTLRFKNIDFWVSPLNWLKEEVIEKTKFPSSKIKVIPLCVETDKYTKTKYSKEEARQKLNINYKGKLVGLIGRISHQKGQHILIESMIELKKQNIDVQMLILGEATINDPECTVYYNKLKQKVLDNDLKEYVHFRDFTKDTAMFYNAIDICTMSTAGETFGMVTIEAMLAGIPIIGTNAAGTAEILKYGELGELFEVENVQSYTLGLINMLNNENMVNQRALIAQKHAIEEYNHHRELNGFIELIEA